MLRYSALAANVALLSLGIAWVGALYGRKTFSYLSILGVFILDFAVLVCASLTIVSILFNRHLSRSRLAELSRSGALALFFSTFCLLRAAVAGSPLPVALVPAVYPVYFAVFLLVLCRVSTANLERVSRALVVAIATSFLIWPVNTLVFGSGEIETPGQTYVIGVALAVSLVAFRAAATAILLFLFNLAVAVFTFQRGVFLCFMLAVGAMSFVAMRAGIFGEFSRRLGLMLAFLFAFVLILPLVLALYPVSGDLRFEVNPENIFLFISSIWSGDAAELLGASGTRSHRIEMWIGILQIVASDINSILFGFGFQGNPADAIGVSFRAPHNGLVTVVYQSGVVGVILFLLFLYGIASETWRGARSERPRLDMERLVLAAIVGAFIGDLLTGTIIDSPFTYFIFLVHAAILISLIRRRDRGGLYAYETPQTLKKNE